MNSWLSILGWSSFDYIGGPLFLYASQYWWPRPIVISRVLCMLWIGSTDSTLLLNFESSCFNSYLKRIRSSSSISHIFSFSFILLDINSLTYFSSSSSTLRARRMFWFRLLSCCFRFNWLYFLLRILISFNTPLIYPS